MAIEWHPRKALPLLSGAFASENSERVRGEVAREWLEGPERELRGSGSKGGASLWAETGGWAPSDARIAGSESTWAGQERGNQALVEEVATVRRRREKGKTEGGLRKRRKIQV